MSSVIALVTVHQWFEMGCGGRLVSGVGGRANVEKWLYNKSMSQPARGLDGPEG